MFLLKAHVTLWAIIGVCSQITLVASMPNLVSPAAVSDTISPTDQINPLIDESAKASLHLYHCCTGNGYSIC